MKRKWFQRLEQAFHEYLGEESMSDDFKNIMQRKLQDYFWKKVGINLDDSKGRIIFSMSPFKLDFEEYTGVISTGITVYHYFMPCKILWNHISKKSLILPTMKDLDYDKIDLWVDNLDTKKIQKAYYKKPPQKHFKNLELNSKLILDFCYIEDVYLQIRLQNKNILMINNLKRSIEEYVIDWNSNVKPSEYGDLTISDWLTKNSDQVLSIAFDFTHTPIETLAKLIKVIDMNFNIEKMRVTSYP